MLIEQEKSNWKNLIFFLFLRLLYVNLAQQGYYFRQN